MKTLTEFHGFALKTVAQVQAELAQAGKTAEEITSAVGEKLKAEGDKLKHLMTAFEAAKDRLEKLKRVLVIQPAEGAKLVRDAIEKEGLHFVLEFFPDPAGQQRGRRDRDDQRGGRDGKKGGRGGKGKRGGGRGGKESGDRGQRGERRAAPAGEGAENAAPRAPRAPRPPRERKPEEPPKPFVPSGKPALILPKSAAAASAPKEPATS
jgi:hypothetical protein